MRNVARLKMGYYPSPESDGVRLRSLLSLSQLLWRSIRYGPGIWGSMEYCTTIAAIMAAMSCHSDRQGVFSHYGYSGENKNDWI
jgi:hypothetical protein